MTAKAHSFLRVFLNTHNQSDSQSDTATQYKIEIPLKVQLRDYQRQGVQWMASLG